MSQGVRTSEGFAERNEFRIEVPDSVLIRGENVIAVRARDRGSESYVDLVVTVDEPSSTVNVSADQAFLFRYDVVAIDPDLDQVTFRLGPDTPTGMAIDATSGVIRWFPTDGQIGMHVVKVFAEDDKGGIAEQTFTVCVHPVEGNHAPIIVSEPRRSPCRVQRITLRFRRLIPTRICSTTLCWHAEWYGHQCVKWRRNMAYTRHVQRTDECLR